MKKLAERIGREDEQKRQQSGIEWDRENARNRDEAWNWVKDEVEG